MLPKRLFLGALLLTILLIITGCATTGKPEDRSSSQYENASYECISWGYRRGTYDYNRCMDKRLKSRKKILFSE